MARAEKVVGVSAKTLKWARETAGRTQQEVAATLRKPVDTVIAWEEGVDWPSYNQLERLATMYRRPLALFFFPEPPHEDPLDRNFRLLPGFHAADLGSDVIFALRDSKVLQAALHELTDASNPAQRRIFEDVRVASGESPEALASRVRAYLDISTNTQASWKTDDEALARWRDGIERVGVFVFKRPFVGDTISGFCLDDEFFPTICLNNSNTFGRQSFTLAHEICHVLLDTGGVTVDDETYLDSLPTSTRDLERYCDRFAAELLVPRSDFAQNLTGGPISEEIARLSRRYHVSKQVIVRRLYELKRLSDFEYRRIMGGLGSKYRRPASDSEAQKGNYYATKAAYLGRNFLRLAFNTLAAGRISAVDLANSLGVKARNLPKLEEQLYTSSAL